MNEDTYVKFQEAIDNTSTSLSRGEIGSFAKSGLLLISTVSTGGLTQGLTEVQSIFLIIIFLVIWLVSIYLTRQTLASNKLKLRDAFYNALTPLISTLVVFIVMIVQAIPIMIFIIAYSAAIATDFLSTPFYALLFFLFSVVMLIISTYLLSSSIIALIVTTIPGYYPLASLKIASDTIAGRRIKFLIRIIFLLIVIAIIFVIIMLPIILIDLILKSSFDWLSGLPFVPLFLVITTSFSLVYASVYLYLFYRQMLEQND